MGVLTEFAKIRSSENEKLVINSLFDLKDESFEFKLLNKVQFDIFYELKQEILDALRRKLQNSNIQIEAIITTEESKAKPRTEQEKFEMMLLKNPYLKTLKENLGLDLMF